MGVVLQQNPIPFLKPVLGNGLLLYLFGSLVAMVMLIAILQTVPKQFRRRIILLTTFIGGLFYALEFFLPVSSMPTPANANNKGNFLTPYVVPFGVITQIVVGWTIGLGIINLTMVHGKRLLKPKQQEAFWNSAAFFICMFLMTWFGIAYELQKNAFNDSIYKILFVGALQSLDATMFSIIAFYIVSAAYRAFRVRTLEASLLLATAFIVMLGQIALGQWLTQTFPSALRVETIRGWILDVANAAATRAIAFGLGIGSLAVALRIWLGLERGSYFDKES